MNSATITRVFSEAIAAAIPQAELSVSQWAAAYRYIAPERTARPGRWRNEVVPYLAEIMDTVREPGVRETVFVASAQVAKTECLNNVIGYFMHVEPAPILFLCETQEKAEAWSKESLAPMIRDTPVLAGLVGDPRSRDSNNTVEGKSFPGGHLAIAWATSAATLSSRPRRVVLMDERDAYKATAEGDPAKLAEKRATTFPDAVIVKVSTPRDRMEPPPGSPPDAPRYSPIELEYENSDKRRYRVPCPHCGEYQPLAWANVRFDAGDPLSAVYMCAANGCAIEHESKADMLTRGRWVAEKPFNGRAGFHIWEGYSPFVTWGEMARNFLEAKKSPHTLKVFVNTSLGEGWEDAAEQAGVNDLEERREDYSPELLPEGVLVMTAAVDVQGDRLEAEKVGWGLDEESWSVGYKVFDGDPSQPIVWSQLFEWLTQDHEYEVAVRLDDREITVRGTLRAACVCVDSGGHHTKEVYAFARRHAGRRFYAIKGANTPGKPVVSKPSKIGKPPVLLYAVGGDAAKDTLAARLLIREPGPGFCHFPEEQTDGVHVYYDERYFRQLRSERPVTAYTKRGAVRTWQKIKKSARNEALDVRVYNMAALAILNPDYKRIAKRRYAAALQFAAARAAEPPPEEPREDVRTPAHEPDAEAEPEAESRAPRRRSRRGGRNWVNGWR